MRIFDQRMTPSRLNNPSSRRVQELRGEIARLQRALEQVELLPSPAPTGREAEIPEITALGFFEFDWGTGEFLASPAARLHHGIPPDADITADLLWRTVHPDDRGWLRNTIDKLHQSAATAPCTAEYRTLSIKDGRVRRVSSTVTVIAGPEQRPPRLLGVLEDVTEPALSAQALRDSEARLEAIEVRAGAGSWELESGAPTATWSPGLFRLFYVDPASGVPTLPEFIDMAHPADRDIVRNALDRVWRGEAPVSHEFRSNPERGPVRYFSARIEPVTDSEGRVHRIVGNVLDVTESKKAQDALRESEARFRLIADTIPNFVWTASADGSIEYANRFFRDYTGKPYGPGDLNDATAVHPDDLPGVVAAWREAVQTGQPLELTSRARRRDGVYRWQLIRAVPVRDAEGGVMKWYATATDIHDIKDLQEHLRASEERWHFALEGAGDGVWDWHTETGVYYSQQWKAMLGYAENEIGNSAEEWEKRVHPDDRADVRAALRPLEMGESDTYSCEFRLQRKDSSYLWVLARGKVIDRRNGQVLRVIGTMTDVSARKAYEAEISRLSRLYAALSQINQSIVRARSQDELFEEVTQVLVKFGGFSMAWIGWWDHANHAVVPLAQSGDTSGYLRNIQIFTDDRPEGRGLRERRTYLCNDFASDPATLPWRKAAATSKYRSAASFLIWMGGEVWGTLAVYSNEPGFFGEREQALLEEAALDVSFALDNFERERQRLLVEASLRESDERLKLALDAAGLGTFDWDLLSGKIVWDGHHNHLFGFRPGEFDGSYAAFAERIHPEDLANLNDAVARARDTRTAFAYEFRVVWPDGSLHWVAGHGEFSYDAGGRPLRMRGAVMDISERKVADVRVRDSEARYRRIVNTAAEGIAVFDTERITTFVNTRMADLLGFTPTEMIGQPVTAFLFDEDAVRYEDLESILLRGESVQAELRLRHRDGREVFTLVSGTPVLDDAGRMHGSFAMFTDLTTRKHAEEQQSRLAEQFQQAQKLESIGRLAGGVAHDFNNLLTIIGGYAELVMEDLSPNDPILPSLEKIQEASGRATSLIRQLLAFSRKQVLQPEVVNLNDIIDGMGEMLPRLLGEDVELVIHRDPSLRAIMADRHQVEQVIMNLAVNSRDAMPHGGTILISTENMVHSGACPLCSTTLQPGARVKLTVRDVGTGMDAKTRRHLFEPFFTTKPPGKGTGLGLATVHGIVMQSGGHIDVESEPGAGTTFHISLPALETKAPRPAAAHSPVALGTETILLVEDQPEVRRFTATALSRYGYRVIEAAGGDEALARLAGQRIDLLVTDVIMPKMNGPELAARVRTVEPLVKILFISGHAESSSWGDNQTYGGEFLHKPFTPQALAAKVREVLNKPHAPARSELH